MEAEKKEKHGKKKKSDKIIVRKLGQGTTNVGKAVKMDLMKTFLTCVMGQLSMIFGSGSHEELIGRYKLLSSGDVTKYKLTRSFIHNTSRDFFGTWIPTMKFHGTPFAISAVSGVLTTVVRLRASELAYFNSFSAIFDEYRFKGPIALNYRPTNIASTGSGACAYGVGVIDMVDGTILASTAGALMYDTAKIFPLTMPYTGNLINSWETRLLGNPDNIWLDTSVQTNDVCYFKTYNYAAITGSVTYGYVEWVTEIEFRQLFGI